MEREAPVEDEEAAADKESHIVEHLENEEEGEAAPGPTTAGPAGSSGSPQVPGVAPGLSAAVEGQSGEGQQEPQQGPQKNAVDAIDPKVSKARERMYNREDKRRQKRSDERIKTRSGGKDWTAADFVEIMKKSGAQGVLIQLGTRKPQQGIGVLKAANQWDPLIAALPIGGLNAQARRALDKLVDDQMIDLADQITLFEVRFKHKAEGVASGATNAVGWNALTMQVTWRQLAALPPADVTLNTAITTFRAISGDGAFGPSWEDLANINTVDMGQDNADAEDLSGTVRHEIGHGVHGQIMDQVNPWLKNDMEFWFTDDFDEWINMLGGYPKDFVDSTGTKVVVDGAWKAYLKTLVENFTGSGGWGPAKVSPEDGETPDGQAAWAAMPAAVKNACAQSTNNFYQNFESFQKKGNKHYFLNHYYHRGFWIGDRAMATIHSTNDKYSAMSEKEFFANCYSEYFRDSTGIHHPENWGGNLPGSVKSFFKDVVVHRNPYTKFKKKEKQDKKDQKK